VLLEKGLMKFCTVDAFTDTLFKGNPAAVCVVDTFPSDDFMQSVATEVNLSETAFIVPLNGNHFEIRWFTPKTEVNLCGHATLAAAHVLWTELAIVTTETLYFESKSGVLKAWRDEHGITLDFPATQVEEISTPDGLLEALGVSPVFVGRAGDDYLVELLSAEEVVNLSPNIAQLAGIDCAGIVVTAESDEGSAYDFLSRYFAPREGILEDPVTGSAHCKLATYWSYRLKKNEFNAYQASKRGGYIKVRYEAEGERALLTGNAVTAFSGKFLGVA
jgi:PhzF family phenazine biosynthesis protein